MAGSLQPVSVTATVSYQNAGPSYLLAIGIEDMTTTPQRLVSGIPTSTPDPCTPQLALAALCTITPHNSSGLEHLEFKIGGILGNPLPQGNWKLNMTAALFTSDGAIVQNSASSVRFTITVSPMILTIKVPSGITVTVDGTQQSPGSIQLPMSAGTHTISVPRTVQVNSTTRLSFDSWTDGSPAPNRTITVQTSQAYQAVYVTQYLLTITGQAVSASGQGWYDAGSTAYFSVPQTEPIPGIVGSIGGKLTFQGWYENNQLLADTPEGMIVMNKPHTLTVNWNGDYNIPIIIISAVVLIALGLAYFAIHRMKSREAEGTGRAHPETKEEPTAGARRRRRRPKRMSS